VTEANLLLITRIEEKAKEIKRCIKTHNPGVQCSKPVSSSFIRQDLAELMILCSQLRTLIEV